MCLQNTHWTQKDEPIGRSVWKDDCIINGKSSNSRGVTNLLCNTFECNIVSMFKDDNGNLIHVDNVHINMGDIHIKLLNLYTPIKDSL